MEAAAQITVDPSKIMQIGTGFFGTKTLLTAVNMELFTVLAKRDLSGKDIQTKLGLHSRSLYDFLDALVSMNKQSYIGGMLEMCNNRLYPFWNDLEDGLKTGLPQNETKNGGKPIFEAVYGDPKKLREFVGAMAGVQMGNFMEFAKVFDFSKYKTLCDIGGAGGFLAAHVAMNNQHMHCTSMDLPQVEPIAKENIQNMGLKDMVKITSGDFFTDNFPKSDVITMGNILHDWGTKDKKMLIKKAYDALPKGGAFVVIENIIDNNRSKNAFGLLMSLNMLIETTEGYDFSFSDFDDMVKEAGFKSTALMPLTGPTSAAIALK